jgi:hypothetical protein
MVQKSQPAKMGNPTSSAGGEECVKGIWSWIFEFDDLSMDGATDGGKEDPSYLECTILIFYRLATNDNLSSTTSGSSIQTERLTF